jgi:CRISPR-associated exonuclease Cas4
MAYHETDYLQLSGIQHFAYCPRQWALIHLEQQWNENLRTFEGRVLHERVHDSASSEKRGYVLTVRGMQVFSRTLGISGECDVVEFHQSKAGVPLHGRKGLYLTIPIEYKRGKPKEHDADRLQLCAQAICLEEMLVCEISQGYLFYGEIRRRTEVLFDAELRQKATKMFAQMHEYATRGYTPKVKPNKGCNACSLKDICVPELNKSSSARAYINARLKEEADKCESF